jgi:hypothetical protein
VSREGIEPRQRGETEVMLRRRPDYGHVVDRLTSGIGVAARGFRGQVGIVQGVLKYTMGGSFLERANPTNNGSRCCPCADSVTSATTFLNDGIIGRRLKSCRASSLRTRHERITSAPAVAGAR